MEDSLSNAFKPLHNMYFSGSKCSILVLGAYRNCEEQNSILGLCRKADGSGLLDQWDPKLHEYNM